MKLNITYIVSDVDRAVAFEWIALGLNKEKFNISFILLNTKPSYLQEFLEKQNIPTYFIQYRGKKTALKALFKTINYLRSQKTQIVHCHLFNACIIGLTAAKLIGVKKRIYTRHHSTYHHSFYPKAVKWDRYCNYVSTEIISISKTVTETLVNKENVRRLKIHEIYHGFDIKSFDNADPTEVTLLKEKYNPHKKYPVIGVISRFIEWKGVQYIIPAFRKILNQYPNALLLLFNAEGNYEYKINVLLNNLPEHSFKKVAFEKKITSLYHVFNVFVHTPIDDHSEAFGQVYIEALAAGIPSVFSLSGIANEFIKNNSNALVVPYKNSEAIAAGITKILENKLLAQEIADNGKKEVDEKFSLYKMLKSLEEVYEK